MKHRTLQFLLFSAACLPLLSCSQNAQFFSVDFTNFFVGDLFPITPGPRPGFVMAMGVNNTDSSVEFVATAESSEIIVQLDGTGIVTTFAEALLPQQTANLFTDVDSRSLGIVFSNSPVDWPPTPPGQLTQADVQSAVDQLAATDPGVQGRPFVRLVRVLRIGLGPDLNVPSGADNGLIIRPAFSVPEQTAGTILPSGVNSVLSYDDPPFTANFGNGDLVMFLGTVSNTAVGGVVAAAGIVQGSTGSFERETFLILRRELGPISGAP